MPKKYNMSLFNRKFNVTYKHVEILLIIITMLIGVCVVYLYSKDTNLNIEELKVEKFQSNKKLLLFYAPWCGASKRFLPTWEKIEENQDINTDKYNVDIDENKEISDAYNIEFLPTVFLVNNGQATKYEGNRSYEDLLDFYNN
jgi:thiol-disulfide isomerase/thioredoxin